MSALYSVLQFQCTTLENVHLGVVIVQGRKVIVSRFTKSADRIRLFGQCDMLDETLTMVCGSMLASLHDKLLLSGNPADWHAHYMASVQWREFMPTLVNEGTIDRLFKMFVAPPLQEPPAPSAAAAERDEG